MPQGNLHAYGKRSVAAVTGGMLAVGLFTASTGEAERSGGAPYVPARARRPAVVHRYVFPVRAHHTYGDPFGVARTGHRHQGQDIMAACGAPIVAARGGVVKDNKFQYAAGNYLVIDGAGTGRDFFYAHMRRPSKLRVGKHVRTGQRIGSVGQTGDATACHLHFEVWTPPGWYSGGHPIDPRHFLRAWDRFS